MTIVYLYRFLLIGLILLSSLNAMTKEGFLSSLSPHALTALSTATEVMLDPNNAKDVRDLAAQVVHQMVFTGGYHIDDTYKRFYGFRRLASSPQHAIKEKSIMEAAILTMGLYPVKKQNASLPKEMNALHGYEAHKAYCDWLIQYGEAVEKNDQKLIAILQKDHKFPSQPLSFSSPLTKTLGSDTFENIYTFAPVIVNKVSLSGLTNDANYTAFFRSLPRHGIEIKNYQNASMGGINVIIKLAIDKIPLSGRKDVLALALRIIDKGGQISDKHILKIFKLMSEIPANKREAVLKHAETLPFYSFSVDERVNVLKEISHISEKDRGKIITSAKTLINYSSQDIDKFNSPRIGLLIKALYEIGSDEDSNKVIELTKQCVLRERDNLFYTIVAMTILCKVPKNERFPLINYMNQFFNRIGEEFRSIKAIFFEFIAQVSVNHRQDFINFLINNRVILIHEIGQLSQVPDPADWQATLAGIRAVGVNQIVGFNNQTIHAREFEESLKNSFEALKHRYREEKKLPLEELRNKFLDVIAGLKNEKLLTNVEANIISHFFNQGIDGLVQQGDTQKITEYLNLVWAALHDEKAAKEALKRDVKNEDFNDRMASWLKQGPLDAQLAYSLDKLGEKSLYKTKEDLLKVMENDTNYSKLIDKGKSCVGGSYNRLIEALNHMHEDVNIDYGNAGKVNQQLYTLNRHLSQQGLELLEKANDEGWAEEKIKELAGQALNTYVEQNKNDYNYLSEEQINKTIEAYLEGPFNDALLDRAGLKEINDYIANTLGTDLTPWLKAQKTHFDPGLKELAKEKAKELILEKMKDISASPENKQELIDAGMAFVPQILSQYWTDDLLLPELRKAIDNLPDKRNKVETETQEAERIVGMKEYLPDQVLSHIGVKEGSQIKNTLTTLIGNLLNEEEIYNLLNAKELKKS